MKIGILTLPFNNNYGGYLQAYALMTVLKNEGHSVELIYRRNNRLKFVVSIKIFFKNIVKLIIGRKIIGLWPNQEKWHRYRGARMLSFVDKYITPQTKPLFSSRAMYNQIKKGKYDMIIVGSDQVWRPDYGQEHVQDFFLTELPAGNLRIISYAASFGLDTPSYTEREIEECGKAIYNFDAVSVRENIGIDIINEFGWKVKTEPVVVLDPTFLLSKEHYNSLLPQKDSAAKGKIFSYVLDKSNDTNSIIEELSKQTGIEVYNIIDTEKWQSKEYVMPSVEDWLVGFRDAAFVVTDSYHGTVFSIIFNKPFITKQNSSRGSTRFKALLERTGLEKRLIQNYTQVKTALSETICWSDVNNTINKEIIVSIRYLESLINN